ncbi:hypothetical protein [Methanosarcina sp. UBA5]|uniref:hypothetical protein n=1 Tax=Methanosarcina sp. UBA5 TaxID=1915593 RepID=UPI0025F4ACC3|nr:hypothetical protein [Methanosarcina sp. UBA5]
MVLYRKKSDYLLPKEAQKKVKQKLVKRTIDRLPATFPYLFKALLEGKRPPARNTWFEDLERWSYKAGITPKVNPKTPRKKLKFGARGAIRTHELYENRHSTYRL